jgi:DNA-binding MarR family transcriptional regulator
MSANDLDQSPMHLIHRASQVAADIFAVEMTGIDDLTPRQLAVLVTVAAKERLSQAGVFECTGIDPGTVAGIVKRLQRKGLLQRRRTKRDPRAYAVRLTDRGRRVLKTAEPLRKRIDERILNALPPHQRGQFIERLRLIVDTLQG